MTKKEAKIEALSHAANAVEQAAKSLSRAHYGEDTKPVTDAMNEVASELHERWHRLFHPEQPR